MPIKIKEVKSRRVPNLRAEAGSGLQIRNSTDNVAPSVEEKR